MQQDSDKTEKFGRYELLEHLATGGMARIYRASTNNKRSFILKQILQEYSHNEEFIRMFLQEAKISLALKHPNIVRVLDFGQLDKSYYLAMEYVFGKDLGSLLKASVEKKAYIPIDVACYVVMNCCRALDFAHTRTDAFGNDVGVIHRDISPPNILVSYNGESKILDFGIAKARNAAGRGQTRSGVLKGKFCYMSPEQARGEALNPQSDIYSIGIVFHELLSSKSLFYSKDEIETLEKVRKGKAPSPKKYRKDLPEDIERIVMKALEPKLRKRYQSGAQMAEDIKTALQKHYPRTDDRSVAKLMRTMFRDDFNRRMKQAKSEGWRDIFVSGGADEELMLDRNPDLSSEVTIKSSITKEVRVGFWHRLLYDPKISHKFYRVAGLIFLVGLLSVGSFYIHQSGAYQKLVASFEKEEPAQSVLKNRPVDSEPEQGTYAYWLQKAEEQEDAGEFKAALASLNQALKINSFDQSTQVQKHFLEIQLNRLNNACAWFKQKTEISDRDRILAEAMCAERRGQTIKAINAYSEVLRRYPNSPRSKDIRSKVKQLVENAKR